MTSENVNIAKISKLEVDYLKELLIDRTVLTNYPNLFIHVAKILEKEILKTRCAVLSIYGIYSILDSDLPEPSGPKVNLQCKVYMPAETNSSFNFVGRILGPDGSTAKCLQQCLGVKIMVRGRGSMRDRKKEEANIGRPNWEHLSDKLHVVLTVDDFESRANVRLAKASEYITLFLKESTKGSDREDKVKQMQLMELSFQRDLRSILTLDCQSLMELNKAGSFYPDPANLLNFAAYPAAYHPTPLFPVIHEATQPHHASPSGYHARPYYPSGAGTAPQAGQQATQPAGQQQQHQQQQQPPQQQQPQQQQSQQQQPLQQQHSQGHFTSAHGGHLTSVNNQQLAAAAAAAAAAMSVGGLAFPSSSLSTNLGGATLLLGPANSQGHHHQQQHHHHHQQQQQQHPHQHHPGAYSPPVQVTGNGASGLPAGTVAVAPMNYWQAGAGPHALSQMSAAHAAAAAAVAAASLDFHAHAMHHQHHEHLGQAASYPLPGAPYATAHSLHPLGFAGELVQPTLGHEYSLTFSRGEGQPPMEASVQCVPANGLGSEMPVGDARCSEASASPSAGSAVISEGPGSDTTAAEEKASTADKSGRQQAPANTASLTPSAVPSKTSGAMQSPAKYSVGGGSKQRYSQKHRSQFNMGRGSQPTPLLVHQTTHHHQQQQHQLGTRTGRSEVVTVHVGSADQTDNIKPVQAVTAGETSRGSNNNKNGLVGIGKQKGSSSGNTASSAGVKSESVSTTVSTTASATVKETRGGPASKSQGKSQATSVTKKTTLTALVPTNDADWPKLGADVKLSKCNAVADSQIGQGLMNLPIGNTSPKAI